MGHQTIIFLFFRLLTCWLLVTRLMITFCNIWVSLFKFLTGHEDKGSFIVFIAYSYILILANIIFWVPFLHCVKFRYSPWISADCFTLSFEKRNTFPGYTMHIFEMTAQISALSKSFLAFGTCKGSLTCMFSKVIPQIAAFLKNGATTTVTTFKIEFDSHSLPITYLNCLMPGTWNALKCLRFWAHRVLTSRLGGHFATFSYMLYKSFRFFLRTTNLWVVTLFRLSLEPTLN